MLIKVVGMMNSKMMENQKKKNKQIVREEFKNLNQLKMKCLSNNNKEEETLWMKMILTMSKNNRKINRYVKLYNIQVPRNQGRKQEEDEEDDDVGETEEQQDDDDQDEREMHAVTVEDE